MTPNAAPRPAPMAAPTPTPIATWPVAAPIAAPTAVPNTIQIAKFIASPVVDSCRPSLALRFDRKAYLFSPELT